MKRAYTWVVPVVLLLAAFVLRVYRIGDYNVWWDEGFSIVMARMPLREMAVRTAADVHPPLHYAFLHYWIRLVGESEYAVRYSTALFGVLDVALLFWLARRYLGLATAIVAVCLIAVNRLHVEWSQAMRMYTLATALVLGSTACFLRLTVDRDQRRRWWIGHLLLSVVGLHTIYIFGMAPLAQSVAVGAAWLLRRVSTRFLLAWVGVQAMALALFTPWFVLYRAQWRDTPAVIYPIDLVTWLRAVFTAMPVGISAYLDAWTPLTVGATLLLLWPLLRDRGRNGWLQAMSYVALLGGPVLIYGLSYPNPVMYAPNLSVRYLMLFLPLYALLVARALVSLRPLSFVLAPALLAVCVGTLFDFYSGRVLHDEYRTMASFMTSYREPGDLAVLYSDWDWPVYQYYAPRDMESYGVGTLDKLTAGSAAELGQRLFAEHPSVWLVTYNEGADADPDGHFRRWLDGNARALADFRVANRRLTLFTRDSIRTLNHAVPPRGRPIALPSAPPLRSVEQPVREVQAGGVLHLATFWSTPGQTAHLELVGPNGEVYRRAADTLLSAATRGDHNLQLADRLPPGPYTVRLDGGPLARIALLPPEHAPATIPPPPTLPERHDRFGDALELVGAQSPSALEASRPMQVRLLWQSVTAMERPYTGFLQLVGERPNPATGNPVWAQLDAPPDRTRPTNDWLPRDYALDERSLDVPASLPPGRYELIAGLYDPADGQRLKLPDGADHALLAAWP